MMIYFHEIGFEKRTGVESRVQLFILVLMPTIFTIVSGDAKASFLSSIPIATTEGVGPEYEEYPIHDADIKIPGRHSPKRPYVDQVQDDTKNSYADPASSIDSDYANNPYQDSGPTKDLPQGDSLHPLMGPYFDRALTRNVTVQAGKTAELTCKVQEISKKSVSWIRLRDLHILTVDKYKYSTDLRVTIDYEESQHQWVLKIRDTKHSDAGKYECQISTRPVLSFIVNLEVVDEVVGPRLTTPYPEMNDQKMEILANREVPKAYIVNSPDIHVHRGSLINLTCVVNHGVNQPVYIYWYHQNQLVDIENSRRNVEMFTKSKGQTLSQLIVNRARLEDSGKYVCKPSNGDSAPVTLHVLKGEQQAAMQTNHGGRRTIHSGIYFTVLFSFFIL